LARVNADVSSDLDDAQSEDESVAGRS
jgi:hypothetical protein